MPLTPLLARIRMGIEKTRVAEAAFETILIGPAKQTITFTTIGARRPSWLAGLSTRAGNPVALQQSQLNVRPLMQEVHRCWVRLAPGKLIR